VPAADWPSGLLVALASYDGTVVLLDDGAAAGSDDLGDPDGPNVVVRGDPEADSEGQSWSEVLISPDGKRIALVRSGEVWVARRGGGAPERLVGEAELQAHDPAARDTVSKPHSPVWVPRSSLIAFTTRAAADSGPVPVHPYDLWTVDAGSGELRKVVPRGVMDGYRFSPDGRWIVLLRVEGSQERSTIFVERTDIDGTDRQLLTEYSWAEAGPVGTTRPSALLGAWSSDGSAFRLPVPADSRPDAETLGHDEPAESVRILSLRMDGRVSESAPVDLSPLVGYEDNPRSLLRWSPDGDRLAYVTPGRDGSQELTIADADGGRPRVIATAGRLRLGPWSPDSRRILYREVDGGAAPTSSFIADVDGTATPQPVEGSRVGTDWVGPEHFIDMETVDPDGGIELQLRDLSGGRTVLVYLDAMSDGIRAVDIAVAGRGSLAQP
jgi:dipeptidyl aminopeptidase/acylaminoacyl peptidase